MTPRPRAKYPKIKVVTVRMSVSMFQDMSNLQSRDGIPVSEQIRRAIRAWLKKKGVTVITERKRAGTRKRLNRRDSV